jgi:hypothetical protein
MRLCSLADLSLSGRRWRMDERSQALQSSAFVPRQDSISQTAAVALHFAQGLTTE